MDETRILLADVAQEKDWEPNPAAPRACASVQIALADQTNSRPCNSVEASWDDIDRQGLRTMSTPRAGRCRRTPLGTTALANQRGGRRPFAEK